MDWKNNLDPVLKDYLNELLREVLKHKAYKKAWDVGKAQIWVALAILYREIMLLKSVIDEIKSKLYENENKEKLERTLKKY